MPDAINAASPPPTPTAAPVLAHQRLIERTLPDWLVQAPEAARQTLRQIKPAPAHWPPELPHAQRTALNQAHVAHWKSHHATRQHLDTLTDIEAFATSLLREALIRQYAIDPALDLKATFINLYIPLTTPLLNIPTGAVKNWRTSMLGAALHNFEAFEGEPGAHTGDSGFISKPTPSGQFHVLHGLTRQLPVPGFIQLCRQLDIGRQYKAHLDNALGLTDRRKALALKTAVRDYAKNALAACAHRAEAHGQITPSQQASLNDLGEVRGWTRAGPAPLYPHSMTLLGKTLTGVLIFSAHRVLPSANSEIIAYVPDDPLNPLKRYASMADFVAQLALQLRAPLYQQYFCRFIDHQHVGEFFADLKRALFHITADPPSLPEGQGWPEDYPLDIRTRVIEHPVLEYTLSDIPQDFDEYLFEEKRRKLLADAPLIAVSTDAEDQKTRHDRQARLKKVGEWALNALEMVGAIFVPGLGELMLLQMAYQILDDTYEGIKDWTEGKTLEAWDHLFNVVSSLTQAGALAIGGKIAGDALTPFIARLKPVTLPTGESRLWEPDLAPYAHTAPLPEHVPVNDSGLQLHEEAQFLTLDDRTYRVEQEARTQRLRIKHPSRTRAYSPRLRHNGTGAWSAETEQPLYWDDVTLFQRLSPTAARLPADQASRLLALTDTGPDLLRRLHVDALPTPPLLADSISRFVIEGEIQGFIDDMESLDPLVQQQAHTQTQLQLLTHRDLWNVPKGLRVVSESGEVMADYPPASGSSERLQVRHSRVREGHLLEDVLQALDEPDAKTLLAIDPAFGDPLPDTPLQISRLRTLLAELARRQRVELFKSHYASASPATNDEIRVLQAACPELPTAAAQALIWNARGDELLQLLNQRTLAPRLHTQALQLLHESRINRTYEGLFLDSTSSPQTEWLILNTIESLPGWSKALRLEIRQDRFDGLLLNSLGDEQAAIRKVLIKSENRYSARDAEDRELHGPDDLYAALLHALPDAERNQLGFPHVGQGNDLKRAVRHHPLLPRHRVSAQIEPARTVLDIDPLANLPQTARDYPLLGADAPGSAPDPLDQRVYELYPSLNIRERARIIRGLPTNRVQAHQALTDLGQALQGLRDDLEAWTLDAPAVNQRTGELLPPSQRVANVQDRRAFSRELERCWRHQTAFDNHYADPERDGFELTFTRLIVDSMPPVNADFSHVTFLYLRGFGPVTGVDEFLQRFPRVRVLQLQGFELDVLPESIFSMPNLTDIHLESSAITLTPETAQRLAGMERLEYIDLDDNPLNVTPDFSSMTNLNTLHLSNTELTEFPLSVLDLPGLEVIDLSENLIIELPEALFEAPASITQGLDLQGNPLSVTSLNRVRDYFAQTGLDMNIELDVDVPEEAPDIEE